MTVLADLAHFIATDGLETDDDTLCVLADGVVDTFGCIVAGADQPVAQAAQTAIAAMAGKGTTRAFGTNLKVNPPQAAFLNAVAGHSLDFDDWEIPGNSHPTVVILPALLACSPTQTSGADLARAYLAGFEVIARLGEALNFEHYDRGWHSTATLGTIGAAGAVARLLGLSTGQTTHALSIAVSRATGYTCQFGTDAKPMQAGFAAQAGVEAAHLARAGLTGQAHVLDHARGMNSLMAGVPDKRLKDLVAGLGQGLAFTQHKLVLKPWPSCGYTHRIMTAALALASRVDELRRIKKIDVHLPDFHAAVLPYGQPARREEALFSAPFVVSMGLRYQRLNLGDITAQSWEDPDIKALIAKTSMYPFSPARPEMNYDPCEPDRIVLTLQSGAVLEETCTYPIGAPQNPMSSTDVRAKFSANAPKYNTARTDAIFNWLSAADITSVFNNSEVSP